MALAVGVALVFSVYFTLGEIADYLGPGVLIGLFFKSHGPVSVARVNR
jgi:hypothetical protein